MTLSATLDPVVSRPVTNIPCYPVTFHQTGLPSSVGWGVNVLWEFGQVPYTGTGTSLTVQLANTEFGVINYAYAPSISSSGATYYCNSGCIVYNYHVVAGAQSVTAGYLRQTTTSVSCSPSSVNGGVPSTCTATVSGSSPTGTVTLTSSSASGYLAPSNGKCTLSSGSCSVTYRDPNAGAPTVTASYGGDTNNGPSSGATSVTVSTTIYYSVTFSISGMPVSDLSSWGVSVNGVETTQTHAGTASIAANVLAYPQTYQFDGLVSAGTAGLYSCASGCSGTVSGSGTISAGYVSTAVLSELSCESVAFGGTWTGSTCTISSYSIGSTQTLEIPSGVTLAITDDGILNNAGRVTIDNGGTLTIEGGYYNPNGDGVGITQLTNTGTINNAGTINIDNLQSDHSQDGNDGIDNGGTINNEATGVINVDNGNGYGLDNYGTILNSGTVNVANPSGLTLSTGYSGPNVADALNDGGLYNTATFTNQACGALAGDGSDSYGVTIPSGGCTFPLSFQQSGIPNGVNWGVTIGTTDYPCSTYCTGSGSTLVVSVFVTGSPTLTYSYDTPVAGSSTTYNCHSGCSGSATISGATTLLAASYIVYSPILTTTSSSTSVTLGVSAPTLTDVATLSGGLNPTGSITFTLVAPGGSAVDTETVTVSGDGTYATPAGYILPLTGTVSGTYHWNAAYSGDGTNTPVSETNAPNEQVVVSPAIPSIVTIPSPTSFTLGGPTATLKDSATLSGGYFPTGTITFKLIGPGALTLDTETASVSGDGTYNTPTGYVASGPAGTYQWTVSYSGDSNNVGGFGANLEQVTVSLASTDLTMSCAPPSVASGSSTTCTATVTGGSASVAGETVSFVSSSASGAFSPGASCQLSSSDHCSVSYQDSTSGAPVIAASYLGDSSNAASGGVFILANFAVPASSAASSQVTISGGSASVDQTSQTGVSTAISGSTGSSATIFSADLGTTQPSGTGSISLSSSHYYDVKVSGITTGIALVCITPTSESMPTMEYWTGSVWVAASSITTSGLTICGDIPVSVLIGTNIVVGHVPGEL